MKLGEKLRATVRFIGIFMLMALLALLAMPISVHADTHTVNISTKPGAAGTTTPYDTSITVSSDEGAMVSVSTAANSGYTFLRWVAQYDIGRNITVNSPSATVVTQHLVNVYAEYVDNSTSGIVTKVADSSQGTATGTRPWSWGTDGQYFTISAVPNDPTKYEFDYWKKDGSKYSSSATVEVQMPKIDYSKYDSETGDAKNQVEYTAYFKEKSGEHGFRAIAGSDEGGNITGQPYLSYDSWNASGNVSVTANPDEGYDFVKWVAPDGSDYSKNNAITVPYPSPEPSADDKKNDIVYTAIFKPHDSKGISAEARLDSETGSIGGGSVSPSYVEWSDSNKNQAISFTANPDRNKKFVKWVVPDNLSVKSSLSNPNLSVVMPASKPADNITITAVFAADEKHEVYFDVLGESDGSYSSGLGGTVTPPMIEPKDGENTSVNVQATPWDGYEFEKWELEDSSTTSVVLPADLTKSAISITVKKQEDVTSDVHIRAYFKKATNKGYWTYGIEGGDTSPRYTKWQSGGGSFTISATPQSGYVFDHWEKYDRKTGITNKLYSSDSTCSVPFDAQAPKDNIYFYAVFREIDGIGIYSQGVQGGETSPRHVPWNSSTKGTSITLTATPDKGYEFDHWSYYNKETGVTLQNYSKATSISVIMPDELVASRYYYAYFKKNNEKVKNKEIHVDGKETSITKESFLNKWRTWIDPALKYVRSTIQNMARTHTAEDASVYEGNKNRGYDSGKAASDLKAEIDLNNQFKHTQSFDHPVIMDVSGFSVSEVSGLNTVFVEGTGSITDLETESYVNDKFGELYIGEIVLSGDIYFENEKGERITAELSANSSDATVVMSGIDTASAARWMLVYKDSGENEFIITPITDATSLIRFTLPDQAGGKITLVSVNYR